ncbi:MAG: hypothetical protein HY901_27020 [Deltaproteobacteria bacterium]|nr:hypothetical protein [Deltaproteobacteria bacterium]
MKAFSHLPVIAAVVLLDLGSAPPVHAAAPTSSRTIEQAKKHFQLSKELYDEGNFYAALNELQRSHELVPNYKLLYNLGQIHAQLQDYSNAILSFRRFLVEGGGEVPDARRLEVLKEIEKLQVRVAEMTIESESGAEISVDDVAMGKAPLPGPLTVNVGRRKVTASMVGFFPATRFVDISGLDRLTVKMTLQPMVTTTAEQKRESPAVSDEALIAKVEPPQKLPLWLPWTGTGLLVVGTAVSGILAKQSADDLEAKRATYPLDAQSGPETLRELASTTRTRALITDILGGCAAAAAIASTLYTLLRASDGEAAPAGNPTPQAFSIGVGPGGVAVAGSF